MTVDYLSTLNSSGSGLNITQIVDSLVQAEKDPQEDLIQTKIDTKTTSISAIGEIKSALSSLSLSLNNLSGNTSLETNSTSAAVSANVSDPSTAVAINSSISVTSLAQGQTLAFEDFSSNTSVVGGGSLLLEKGDWSSGSFIANSTIASASLTVLSTDTLESLKDKINSLDYGVTASVIGAGDGTFALVLKSSNGKENALRITATESPAGSGLSAIDNTSTNNTKQKLAGTDASFSVDGIALTRTTNEINDLFTGYTVNLNSSTTVNGVNTPAILSGTVDKSKASTNLQSFVDSINKARTLLNQKTFRGSSTEKPGELSDDPVIKNIQDQLNSLTSSSLSGFGANGVYLSNLGVRTERDGTLTLNTSILENELKNNPTSLDAIFNSMYSSSSSLLSISGAVTSGPEPGSYTFAMSAYVSGAISGLITNDTTPGITSSNNTISLAVDGTSSGTITIPSSEYTSEAALATAIQTAINSDTTLSSAGKSVFVTHSNGSYSITSASTGASSSVVINAIGTNLDGFLKMSGAADTDSICTSQSGTASTALTLNGDSISSNIFTDNAGKRISITSESGDESTYSFTIVGTDISGNAQTEVITGPTSNATVFGTKTFKTVTSVTPSSNSTGSITIGTTGVGITTSGITGSATLNGVAMSADVNNKTFTISTGDAAGLKVKYSGLGSNATIYYGQSLTDKLTNYLTSILDKANGQITTRETTINKEVTDQSALLIDLNSKMESLRDRYILQFSTMEKAVTSLKSTGKYLTDLFDAMNKDD